MNHWRKTVPFTECPKCGYRKTPRLTKEERSASHKKGIQRAKLAGKKIGRPRTRDYEQIKALRATGLSMCKIAKQIGCSPATVMDALKAE